MACLWSAQRSGRIEFSIRPMGGPLCQAELPRNTQVCAHRATSSSASVLVVLRWFWTCSQILRGGAPPLQVSKTPGKVIHNLEARAGRSAQGRGDNERRQTEARHRRTEAIASDWKSRCGYAVVPDSPMWLCVYQALLVQVANELTSESDFPPMRTLRMGARIHCQCDLWLPGERI